MYEQEVIELINKALKDEISAASAYKCMAEATEDATLAKELEAHADDEYGHFKKIIGFTYSHGLEEKIKIEMDFDVTNLHPEDTTSIIEFTQELEKEAIEDYRKIALLARENKDIETETFFTELMKDEQHHFDDLARYNGQRRPLKSFRDFV